MNGYNFSQDVRNALAQARREASELRHGCVGTEHVLLGIIANPESIGGSLLKAGGVDPEQIQDRIVSIVKPGTGAQRGDLRYTSRAKRILELAMSQARELDHAEVNTGHLFLGVMREERGIGAGVLAEFGFTIDDTLLHFGRMTSAGRTEVSADVQFSVIGPRHAVAMLKALLATPRVANVFERHGVDVEAIIRDLLDGEKTP